MSLELMFVIPGWYKTKYNSGDTVQTIRVLGGGTRSNSHFKLMDGREMTESEILENYEYMPTSPTEESSVLPINFGNIDEPIVIEEEPVEEVFIYEPEKPQNIVSKVNKNFDELSNSINTQIHQEPRIIYQKEEINEDEIFVNTLLKQISSEKNKEQFGEVQFKSSFNIPIQFDFKYDLTKLKQILILLNSDDSKIDLFIGKIIETDFNDINQKIKQSIKSFLLNDNETNNKKIYEEKIQDDTKQHSSQSFTSNYLNNIL